MNIYTVYSSDSGPLSDPSKSGMVISQHGPDRVLAIDVIDAAAHVKNLRPHATILSVARQAYFDAKMITADALAEVNRCL